MKPLATLDGRASAPLILEILALPLQTHGTMDGWKRVQPLEIMLFEGAALPNEQTLAIIMPVVDELTSKWHSDNERSLLSMSLIILPFLEDAQAGIAILAELAEQVGLSYEGIRRVVSALGHSRCDNALDVLIAIGTKDGRANSLGEVWINAVAELDTQSAQDVLMSFIDPESSEGLAAASLGRNDVLAQRIAEIAEKNPSIRARLLGLCGVRLDRARRELLGSVIVRLGDEQSLLASLNLLDDENGPELPYELGKAIEDAFVERRPTAEGSNTYTLHPRTATNLRDRLVEMSTSDLKRKNSALFLLSRIESWRLEYGRPVGETRNPIFGSGMPWPPKGEGANNDAS
jgi:hypothetical protein